MSIKKLLAVALTSGAALASFACNGGKNDEGATVTINGVSYNIEVSKLVVGMECDYAPFNWTATEEIEGKTLPISNATGYADGYDVQIVRKLHDIMGIEVEIVADLWDSLIPDCVNNSINMIAAGMTDTELRRQSIAFTDEYYRSEVVLIANEEIANQYTSQTLGAEALTSLLKGKNVVSQANTVEDEMIDTFVKNYGCYHVSATKTYALAAVDVQNGSADFLTVELPVAQSYVNNMEGLGIIHINQDILGIDLASLGISIGVAKENTGLIAALNAALATISTETRNSLMTECVERSAEE